MMYHVFIIHTLGLYLSQTIQQHDAMLGDVVWCVRLLLPKPQHSRLLHRHPHSVLPELFLGGASACGCSSECGDRPHSHPCEPPPLTDLSDGLENQCPKMSRVRQAFYL